MGPWTPGDRFYSSVPGRPVAVSTPGPGFLQGVGGDVPPASPPGEDS
jgi:hypothetical protein